MLVRVFPLLWLLSLLTVPPVTAQDKSRPVIGILDFKNSSSKFYLDDFARSFPTLLKTELAQKSGLIVVERQRIEAVIKEQDFLLSDLVDNKDQQARIGSLLGADFMVSGDVSESGSLVRVDVAVMQVSSGRVIAEKALLPSAGENTEAAKLLAANIHHELTGQGSRVERLKLKGAPSGTFLVSSLALGLGTAVSFGQAKKTLDAYRDTKDLDRIDKNYNKTNDWRKASFFMLGVTAVSVSAYIVSVLKNKSSNLEVLAFEGEGDNTRWGVQPFLIVDGRAIRPVVQWTLEF